MQQHNHQAQEASAQSVDMNDQTSDRTTHRASHLQHGRHVNRRSMRRQAGATTGEYLFWSLLAAAVLAISVATYLRGNEQSNSQALIKDFTALAADAGQTFQGNWATFTTVNADSAGLFKGYTSWNDLGGGNIPLTVGAAGTLTVSPGTLQGADDSGEYTLTGLDQNECKNFTTAVQNASGSVTVNGVLVKGLNQAFSPQLMNCLDENNTIVVLRAS
ncbi:hypothetical protein [Trinickia acidisoli]|uniref:hypothetical protein n=1 Tax=Trinickia acidisoli TaxID=2767482 RepID=UPI001A8FCE36|nr:hypothetical protein [Trinickia acidisoli]